MFLGGRLGLSIKDVIVLSNRPTRFYLMLVFTLFDSSSPFSSLLKESCRLLV